MFLHRLLLNLSNEAKRNKIQDGGFLAELVDMRET